MKRHSLRHILLFWAPLAATWVMMAVEGPFLAAIIARLADPKFNLAAHGVAFAFAILVEAPVIMLMSASTALVEDSESYRRLRNFSNALNVGCTAVLLLLLMVPGLWDLLAVTVLGLPVRVAELTHGALWFLLPWPAAIGYRRFLHGLLIRSGRTRLVALGTILRLTGMASTGFLLYFYGELPGAWVGAAALSVGVLTEATAARFMAREAVAELKATPPEQGGGGAELAYREILSFYYPLALTSIIGLTVQPMLTFFMGRAPAPLESLAVFPVVHALSFLFRAPGLSFQEAAIALLGKECEHSPEVGRFGLWLGLASSAGLALVGFTPLASVWFEGISGLSPELANVAILPTQILVPLPALSVLLSYQRATLVQGRRTRPVTVATVIEVGMIAVLFAVLGWGVELVGVTAAVLAFLAGRGGGTLYLAGPSRRVLERFRGEES